MAVMRGFEQDDEIFGTGESDNLSGFGGSDTLRGRRGDDQLDGGDGADLMIGWTGNDTYFVDHVDDLVRERRDHGFFDLVRSTVSYQLTSNVEDLILVGTSNLRGYGNELENRLIGNEGDNVLDGRGGIDRLEGREGNDTYLINNLRQTVGRDGEGFDEILEYASEGIDTVILEVVPNYQYSLPDNVDNINVIKGAFADGNDINNKMRGHDGSNFFSGLGGHDQLYGFGNGDNLSGGDGNDSLFGGSGDDTLHGGGGMDHLYGGIGIDQISVSDIDEDRIYFNVGLREFNADIVGGFQSGEDLILLDRAVFREIVSIGQLDADAFHKGNTAQDAEDRIIYNQEGRLFYDPDGTGASPAYYFATLTSVPNVTAADFIAYGGG